MFDPVGIMALSQSLEIHFHLFSPCWPNGPSQQVSGGSLRACLGLATQMSLSPQFWRLSRSEPAMRLTKVREKITDSTLDVISFATVAELP